jgi:LemA protein
VSGWARGWTWHLAIASIVLTAWIAFHLYYYNLLVDLEFNVKADWAQVEAQFQRRYHIQQNLTRIVIDYSRYEKDVLTRLTGMRTSAMSDDPAAGAGDANQRSPAGSSHPSPPPPQVKQMTPSQLDKLFPDILVMAEQYPQLKLSENFQQFSQAIIDTENQITERIMAYNNSVNIYTTTLKQFPANFFGAVFGFQIYEYYTPDKETLSFQPVKY